MKIMILEDLKEDVMRIQNVISNNYPELSIFQSKDRQEMLDYIEQKEDFTLYFLDIFIGKEALGLEIARKIVAKNNGLIVFTTAYPDTILQEGELQTHTFNIINKGNGNFEKQVLNVLELALAHSNQQCFVIRRRNQTIFIPLDSILYLESVKGTEKTLIVAEYGYFQTSQPLRACEKQLDERFVRSRRTNIVNKTKIRQIDFKEQLIHFDHGITCPLSRLYAKRNWYSL